MRQQLGQKEEQLKLLKVEKDEMGQKLGELEGRGGMEAVIERGVPMETKFENILLKKPNFN